MKLTTHPDLVPSLRMCGSILQPVNSNGVVFHQEYEQICILYGY